MAESSETVEEDAMPMTTQDPNTHSARKRARCEDEEGDDSLESAEMSPVHAANVVILRRIPLPPPPRSILRNHVHAAAEEERSRPVHRVRFGEERVRYFDLTKPPYVLMEEELSLEVQHEFDPIHTAAATVVDCVLRDLECKTEAAAAGVVEESMGRWTTVDQEALRAEAVMQALDLMERCALRSKALGGRPQHDVQAELKRRANQRDWTPKDDAAYIERATLRVPDVLTQRYLPTPTMTLYATAETAERLERVLAALLRAAPTRGSSAALQRA